MGKRKRKKRNRSPRRKRLKRHARLMAAAKWRAGYGGKNLVRGYARWFGVDLICAVVELRMIGVAVDAEYEKQLHETIAARARQNAKRRAARLAARTPPPEIEWWDEGPIDWVPPVDETLPFDEIPF